MKTIRFFTAALLGAIAAGLLAAAPLSAATNDAADIARIEAYMNAMPTVRAEFTQVAPSGTTSSGMFYLQRPGRLRFEYAEPVKNFVVADGRFIHFWDAKNKNQSSAPISQTLADFLLRDKITLSGDIKVTSMRRDAGLLTVNVVERANPDAGALSLVFDDQPMRLRQWQVQDAMGGTTQVTLLNPVLGEKFDNALFRFDGPVKK